MKKKRTTATLTVTEKSGGGFDFKVVMNPPSDADGIQPAGQLILAMMDDFMKKHGGKRG